MSRILSSFSNSSGDLDSLKTEFSNLFRFFNVADIKDKVDFEPYLNEPISEITSKVIAGQKEVALFHFSGHSQGSGLDFPETDFSQDHLVNFFSTINQDDNKLDCVFLNGCKNNKIVERLSNVPVVIGTKTKIQDQVAEKFTRDFFSSLIEAESTYKQAFMDAVSAQSDLETSIIDRTRGEGAAMDLEREESLNEYFLVINDEKVANSTFPFKKKPTNYTKYIAFFLTAIALVLGILFFDYIKAMIKGYECPKWENDDKCRVLVADFNAASTLDINELLSEGIQENPAINPHIESQYAASFSQFTGSDNEEGKELHRTCNYDFTLTGNIIPGNDIYRMEFFIYSDIKGFEEQDGERIEIGNLIELADMVQDVDLNNGNHFILNKMCISCAEKRAELIPVIEKSMKEYRRTMKSPESYQHLNIEMFNLHKNRKDTTKMLKVLDNIADVGKNDFSLGAIERKANILQKTGDLTETYITQTHYVEEVQKRFSNPSQYKMKYARAKYQTQQNKMIAKRAGLVWDYKQQLRPKWSQTLLDLEYLQEIRFQGNDFSSQIATMRELLRIESSSHPKGQVNDVSGAGISRARVQLGNRTETTDRYGRFDFGEMPSNDLFNSVVTISKPGFQSTEFRVSDLAQLSNVTLNKVEAAKKLFYTINGSVEDCNHNNTVLKEIFINGKSVRLQKSNFYDTLSASVGDKLTFKAPSGYYFSEGNPVNLVLNESTNVRQVLTVKSKSKKSQIIGNVAYSSDPIPGVTVFVKGTSQSAVTDTDGNFRLTADVDLCTELTCSIPGVQSKSIYVKNGFDITGRGIVIKFDFNEGIVRDEKIGYEVVLQGLQIQSKTFDKVTMSLKKSGHNVSNKSSNFQRQPKGFATEPTITYYSDDRSSIAKILAVDMKALTGEKFAVKKHSLKYNQKLSKAPPDYSSLILVQWFRRID